MQNRTYSHLNPPTELERNKIIDFLFHHLDQYGDTKEDIGKAYDYAMKSGDSFGGFISTCEENGVVIGAVVVNKTGMQGYIPENILVYIATHNQHRGKGIGKKLMQQVIENTEGSIALHVEPDNPARRLYEQLGFTNKYLEMRLNKKE